ncbi:hypothetical protein PDE_08291 [Penicillium oxalicum 114-2]|uniref:Uncharacterized protein n=1 Tax=Penicillium oxalicum (strain 114-2 / CGMCC 5302) TaxID=933388 RepID=S7ZSG8_PENO1|nr:hypothetical protein PDE_08291 [Penicillium oxalicum 114-2]
MSSLRIKYAELPQYSYQSFDSQYRTIDRDDGYKYAYYPMVSGNNDLTEENAQDNDEPSATEPTNERGETAEAKPEESSTPQDDSATAATPAGM